MLAKLPAKFGASRHWAQTMVLLSLWVLASFVLANIVVGISVALLQAMGAMPVLERGSSAANTAIVAVGTAVYVVMSVILLGVPYWVKKTKPSLKILGIDRLLQWSEIGVAVVGFGLYIVLLAGVLAIASQLPFINLDQSQEIGLESLATGQELVLAFLLLVIIGPFIEELVFRGYLYGKMRRTRAPWWLAVLATSLLFGAVHLQWNVALDTFVLSIVMCLTREVTGSIWPSVLIHMFKNGLAFYVLFIAQGALGV